MLEEDDRPGPTGSVAKGLPARLSPGESARFSFSRLRSPVIELGNEKRAIDWCFLAGTSIVSKCPELGVASCGDTVEEAMANLREAVELYLENAKRLGLLKDTPSLESEQRFTTQFEIQLR